MPCTIIHRSNFIDQSEFGMRRAVFVMIIGNRPSISPQEALAAIADKFDLRSDLLSIHRSKPEDFLLLLPDDRAAELVANRGEPVHTSCGSFLVKPWSRLVHATGRSLPYRVELSLHGIPAHAWELATAEQLLCSYCWIQHLHPNTADRSVRSVFWLTAWTVDPELIPPLKDLLILEPPVAGDVNGLLGKRVLSYPHHHSQG